MELRHIIELLGVAMLSSLPRFQPAETPMVLTDLRHPLIDGAVPNSIQLGPPHGVLVTGSNMSGKSTFIRTVGVNAVLAQTIHTCLAASYDAPAFIVRTFFEETLGPEGIVFKYRLKPGPATTRNAIELLRLLDAPERLVGRALARAAALDAQRGSRSRKA